MRLCFLGNLGSIHLQRWLRYCVERGHEVHYVGLRPEPLRLAGLHAHWLQADRPAPPASEVRATAASRRPWLAGLGTLRCGWQWRQRGLRALLQQLKPDVLHGHFVSEHGFYAALADYQPLVVSAWGSDLLLHPQESWLQRGLVRYALQRSRLVHVLSPELGEVARAFGVPAPRILTAFFGVEEELLALAPRAPDHGPVILSTRMLFPLYDPATVIRAMVPVHAAYPQARLRLVGDGPLRPALERLAAGLGLQQVVEFLGVADAVRLRDLLAGAQVYVSAAKSDGTSVSLLEAMAAGLLPVVADIPANRPWVTDGENGLRFPVGDAQALGQALQRALQDASWRQRAGEQNRALIRARALWRNEMARVEAAYEALAVERRSAS